VRQQRTLIRGSAIQDGCLEGAFSGMPEQRARLAQIATNGTDEERLVKKAVCVCLRTKLPYELMFFALTANCHSGISSHRRLQSFDTSFLRTDPPPTNSLAHFQFPGSKYLIDVSSNWMELPFAKLPK
jgi:hypothetical protein